MKMEQCVWGILLVFLAQAWGLANSVVAAANPLIESDHGQKVGVAAVQPGIIRPYADHEVLVQLDLSEDAPAEAPHAASQLAIAVHFRNRFPSLGIDTAQRPLWK